MGAAPAGVDVFAAYAVTKAALRPGFLHPFFVLGRSAREGALLSVGRGGVGVFS